MSLPASIAAIERDQPVQDRIWAVQRWGWAGLAAAVLLAAAGLFGDGPLAHAEASASDGSLTVAYDRFQRTDATTALRLTGAAPDGRLTLCLDRELLETWRLMRLEPVPEVELAAADGICVVLRGPGDAPAQVRLFVQPRSSHWAARGRLWLQGAVPVELRVLVWP